MLALNKHLAAAAPHEKEGFAGTIDATGRSTTSPGSRRRRSQLWRGRPHPPPSTLTITATTPPTTSLAPSLTVDNLLSRTLLCSNSCRVGSRSLRCSRSGSNEPPLPRLHPGERFTDPLHIPVRLVRPSSQVVFSLVFLVSLLEDSGTSERKSQTLRIILGKIVPVIQKLGKRCYSAPSVSENAERSRSFPSLIAALPR